MALSQQTFIISAQGTSGDIYPLIGIGKELSARGAHIIFLSNDRFCDLVKAEGFEHVSTGTVDNHNKLIRDERFWMFGKGAGQITWPILGRSSLRTSYKYVKSVRTKFDKKPIIMCSNPSLNGAVWAAESFDLPVVHFILSPIVILSALSPSAPTKWLIPAWLPSGEKAKYFKNELNKQERRKLMKPHIREANQLRKKLGLSSIGKASVEMHLNPTFQQIALFPPWYGEPAEDWPKQLTLTNFPLFNDVKPKSRSYVDKFIDSHGAPIIFSFGTGYTNVTSLIHIAWIVSDKLKLPCIFIGGDIEGVNIEIPNKCLHLNYADFEYVFSKSLLAVHHGGIGTMSQAIQAGIPQLIRPTAFDQFDNADKIKALNLGDYLLEKEFTIERVASKIVALLESKKVAEAAHYYAIQISKNNGIKESCDLIEKGLPSKDN
ncbi:glycosyltransferase [Temperatibacter marinus]|uniref:Glycosyltransferase n=1 Tax=Temperatibacter marinus TaxID=1456591 RepID=A0AA52EAY0_9PROT|nr:nucleotide disphospho-sugar-binding domain-containing protein [Temperatibacter marinus]WND01395.1 glycosyltransferase [Temperatibacter marinus]